MPRVDEPNTRLSGNIRVAVATDADDHAANLTGWKQTYDQLTPGRFEGTLRELWLGTKIQVFEETTSHAVRQSCQVWPDAYWFGVPIGAENSIRIGSRAVEANSVAVRPGNAEFELLTPSTFRILGLVVDRDILQQYVAEIERVELDISTLNQEVLDTGSDARYALEHTLLPIFSSNSLQLGHTEARRILQDALLSVLAASCIGAQPQADCSLTYTGRHRLVRRVREYSLAHLDESFSIPDLCRTFRISRRTLQYAFQDVCGISPGAYLRILRLNGVRRALRAPERSFLDVQDLAAQWGFWHGSQFASDYRKLFGERPSETLRRRNA